MVDAAPAPGSDRVGGWRLAASPSAYLRSAHEQAIDWFPWGSEPFELARRTNRPVLLDIGAAWCHWCHVMDEGTYADAEVARILRAQFITVKVDRDENPEVDRRFQRQVGALTGEGGWPLTAFLTPEGDVFLGGTYFPVQDGMGRPGFRRLLKEVARLWKEEPDTVRRNATAVREALTRSRDASNAGAAASPSAFLNNVRAHLLESFDPVNGGFGQAPKFPHPTGVAFLLWDAFASREDGSAGRARTTLLRMADGGLHDQVGGGFHRYTVDEGWHIPHFEKMGVDNAALLDVYVEGARRFGDVRFVETVRDTVEWVQNVLVQKGGGFAASQDADNAPGDDGSYFTWSRPELKAVLTGEELRLVTRVYGVGSDGRMPHDPDRNVLYRLMSVNEARAGSELGETEANERLASALTKLRAARNERPTPIVDTALYADINGAFIRAFAHAGQLLAEPSIVITARRAAERFLKYAYDPAKGVAHRVDDAGGHGWGHLADQAELAYGLVELAGATGDAQYVRPAEELLTLIDREFRADNGVLRDLGPNLYNGPTIGSVGEPSFPLEDHPHLSPNSAAALAMLRLASLTQNDAWREKARTLLTAVQGRLGHAGLFATGAALAVGLVDTPAARLVVEGTGPGSDRLFRAASAAWYPDAWLFRGTPPPPFSLPEELTSASGPGAERLLVCFGTRCLPPVTDPAAVGPLLLGGGRDPPA
ncbi:MAG: thioredoxin domain-containing protein [Thermoplasmata archaeon]|nr:thioredoxin domain-containing protein [Thermoplasmata archaeon]